MAYELRVKSKAELRNYVLRRLGSPVINIEITEDQLDDIISETLEDYFGIAYDGMLERYIPFTFQKDIQEYILPLDVFAVLSVETVDITGFGSNPANMFSVNQYIANDLYKGTGKIDMITYELTNEMIATLGIIFSNKLTFDYDSIGRKLALLGTVPSNLNVMLKVYKKNYPEYVLENGVEVEKTNIYNENWIKKMTTERGRLQWGTNLMKYEGSNLPNGLTLNSAGIVQLALDNINKLEEELNNNYKLPVDFFIG